MEVITGVGRRWRWTDEEKAWIVAESLDPATTVSAAARRHGGLHAGQLFVGRRQLAAPAARGAPGFVPAVVTEDGSALAEAGGRTGIARDRGVDGGFTPGRGGPRSTRVTPCPWFDGKAEGAARFGCELPPDGRIAHLGRAPGGKPSTAEGAVPTVGFELMGQPFMGLDGGPRFESPEAVSLVVPCETQAGIDRLWAALAADGGQETERGWLTRTAASARPGGPCPPARRRSCGRASRKGASALLRRWRPRRNSTSPRSSAPMQERPSRPERRGAPSAGSVRSWTSASAASRKSPTIAGDRPPWASASAMATSRPARSTVEPGNRGCPGFIGRCEWVFCGAVADVSAIGGAEAQAVDRAAFHRAVPGDRRGRARGAPAFLVALAPPPREDQMAVQPFAATGSPSITVPSTKQAIVETLSVQVNVTPPGTRLEAFVNYRSGGQNIPLFVPLTYAYTEPSTQFDFHVAMQEVRLYPDKGTTMTVSVHAPGGNGGTLFLTVSGQLV